MNPRIKISHNNIFCMLLLYHIFQTISSRIKNPKAPVKITSAFKFVHSCFEAIFKVYCIKNNASNFVLM